MSPASQASQSPQPKSSEQLESGQLAEAPFDDAQAELILRSSDEVPVHFRVFKNILSLASPIFADMFNIPSPSPPSEKPHDGSEDHVVPLSENSTTLDFALRHIYPVKRTPKEDPLQGASIIAEFSRKYQAEAALDQFAIGYLKDGIEDDPVGVYAIAAAYGYDQIGANAARSCLDIPFFELESSYMRYATAEQISELFKYHVACGEAASAVASPRRSWFATFATRAPAGILTPQRGGTICQSCFVPDFVNKKSSTERRSGPWCVWNYFHRSALLLARHPTPNEVTMEDFVLQSNDCPSCAPYLRAYMIELGVTFGRKIEDAIAKVPLPKVVSAKSGSTTPAAHSGPED